MAEDPSRKRMRHVWYNMNSRCYDPEHDSFKHYGGRGVSVCERWKVFDNFYIDMADGQFPGCQLDRIDNDGDYTPDNCRWVTARENSRNRRDNRMIETSSGAECLASAAERYGIQADVLRKRLEAGWDSTDALTEPVKRRFSYKRESLTTGEVVKITGLDRSTINKRLKRGESLEDIFEWYERRGHAGRWKTKRD